MKSITETEIRQVLLPQFRKCVCLRLRLDDVVFKIEHILDQEYDVFKRLKEVSQEFLVAGPQDTDLDFILAELELKGSLGSDCFGRRRRGYALVKLDNKRRIVLLKQFRKAISLHNEFWAAANSIAKDLHCTPADTVDSIYDLEGTGAELRELKVHILLEELELKSDLHEQLALRQVRRELLSF